MIHKKLKLIAVFLLGLGLTDLQAQEAIPASGGNALGDGGLVSYSIGQLVYATSTGTNGSVAPGEQQPFEISAITGIEEIKGITLQCSAYPNPTIDFLTLKVDSDVKTQYIASLYDINGKLLESKKLDGNQTRIVMSNLVPATYFLKVTDNNKEVKSFKIIKN